MTFAEKLKQVRGKAGMTQAGLAEASGLGLGTIHDYEQGKKEPTLRSAVRLARALGVSVAEFADSVEGEGEVQAAGAPRAPRGRPRKAPAEDPPAPAPPPGPSPAEPKAEQPAAEEKPRKGPGKKPKGK